MDVVTALRALVAHRTIAAPAGEDTDHAPFEALLAAMRDQFPLLHARCEVTRIAEGGLLIRWAGRSSEDPVILMGHLDVVPINPDDHWTHPPFDGVEADGMVWGRGTLDCKGPVAALCAAVEDALADGFTSSRDVWLSFGCNEEVAGGAAEEAVRALVARGVTPWFVLDEGGAVVSEAFPGVEVPLALIGVGEKGYLDLDLTVTGEGGHSSMPTRNGATARLARAIVRLEEHPFSPHLTEATLEMFARIAPHASGPFAALLSRARHLRTPLAAALARMGAETAAMVRTTIAVTQLEASPARNVLAATAHASVNARVMPGETIATTVRRVRRTIGDRTVKVSVHSGSEPTELAPLDAAFDLLCEVTEEAIPDALPVPYLVMGTTDARHFQRRWPRVYRFNPLRYSPAQRQSLHNVDERVSVASLVEAVAWYRLLLERI